MKVDQLMKETKDVAFIDLIPVLVEMLKKHPEQETIIREYIGLVEKEIEDIKRKIDDTQARNIEDLQNIDNLYGKNNSSMFD